MARVRLWGAEFSAEPIADNGDGTFTMRAMEHTARASAGTTIRVKKGEIVSMAAAETPPSPNESAAALDKAMAAERETLPKPAELLAQFNADQTAKRVSVSPGPTQAPAVAPPQGGKMHLADKLKMLAEAPGDFSKAVESKVDAKLAEVAQKKADALKRLDNAFGKIDAVSADADAGMAAIDAAFAQLTN